MKIGIYTGGDPGAACWGILDGVTTNPSLVAKTGREFETVLREIAFPPSPSVPVMAA